MGRLAEMAEEEDDDDDEDTIMGSCVHAYMVYASSSHQE